MARGDNDNLMDKLRQMSEEGITGFFNEIMSNDRMRSSFGKAGERFMANKSSFDRNVEQMLDFVNIPSKRDVRDLKARLDHLSSQLLNLSIKLDRVLDHEEPAKAKPPPRRARSRADQATQFPRARNLTPSRIHWVQGSPLLDAAADLGEVGDCARFAAEVGRDHQDCAGGK